MKLELSKSALNKNNNTEVFVGKINDSVGYAEYRFRRPMFIESVELDFRELRGLVGSNFGVGVYYRNNEPFADKNLMNPLPITDCNMATGISGGLTDVTEEISINWKMTAILKTPGWYRIVGVVFGTYTSGGGDVYVQ
jgi:hypothetical protein